MPKNFSSSLIRLIPKVDNPSLFSQFWLINLCNFTNKIISKIVANRLSPLLPKIISDNQITFVRGRSIVDNILLVTKMIHSIDRNA